MTRWWHHSSWRAGALVVLVPLVLAVLGVGVVQTQLRAHLMTQAQARLDGELQNFAALYEQRRIIAVRQAMGFRSVDPQAGGTLYLLEDRNGQKLAGNLDAWPPEVSRNAEGFAAGAGQILIHTGLHGPEEFLAAGRTLRGGFPAMVGISLTPIQQTLRQMMQVFALFGAIMLATGLGAAAIVARRSQARLQGVNRFLDDIGGAGGVDARLPPANVRDEYAQLSAHVNAMLDRITHLFEAHKRLGDAVAHEMRTPLARIQARLNDLDIDAAQQFGLTEEIRATIRLFDSLLSIAEMDAKAGHRAGLEPLDLSAVCGQIIDLYQPVAEETGRQLQHRIASDAMILGDAGLMAQLVSNLVENGLKYTRPGDTVTVSLTCTGQRVILIVSDTGPGIGTDLRARMFTPFARGAEQDNQPGHGLGLSLVRAIALRHGAVVRVPEVEKGFALEIDCLQFTGSAA